MLCVFFSFRSLEIFEIGSFPVSTIGHKQTTNADHNNRKHDHKHDHKHTTAHHKRIPQQNHKNITITTTKLPQLQPQTQPQTDHKHTTNTSQTHH